MGFSGYPYVLIVTFLFGIFSLSHAQVPSDINNITNAQLEQFLKQASAKGLSEAQIEAMASTSGYSAQDIATIRERISRLKAKVGEIKVENSKIDNVTRSQIGEVAERTNVAISDTEEVGKKAGTFGSQLFNNKNLIFEPNLRLPTPKNYVLGPDDELKIDITGYAYQHYDVRVSPEGTIRFESLSPIYVNGNTIEQAKYKITDRLKILFAGLKTGTLHVDLTLGNVRTIKITIVGEVRNPGTYSISSLATAFNALYLSGGPNENGSFRNIQIFRNNSLIKKIDLYTFLSKGTLEDNINLSDQDVILIPFFEKKVEISGEVRQKGIFELKEKETFKDLLKYAGSYTEQAYTATININRNTTKEKRLLTFEPEFESDLLPQNGDKFYIGTILNRFENKVEISGAVFRPGEFAIGGTVKTLKQLIESAEGVREDAYLDRAILIREQENLDPVYMPVDLRKLLKGEELQNIELKRQDKLIVKSIVEMRQERNIEITGAVNNPGSFSYADNMSVRDLILMAGGFTDGAATKRIEIARRLYNDEFVNQSVEIITISLGDDAESLTAHSFQMKPFDKIFVRNLPNYTVQKTIQVVGEVNYPGTYAIKSGTERISDIIKRAGGLRSEAYIRGANLYRSGNLVYANFEKALKNKMSVFDLFLENGDRLEIPREKQTVTIIGQVFSPATVTYQPHIKFEDYIAQSGGFSDSAFVKKVYVKYANGGTNRTKNFMGIKIFPKVQQGMTIIVPTRNRVRITPAERIAISTGFISLSAVLLTLMRLL